MECPRCGDVDLDKIFARKDIQDSIDGVPVADISNLSRSCRNARCLKCRFLACSTRLMDRAIIADSWHLRAFNFDSIRLGLEVGEKIPSEKLVLALSPGASTDHFPENLIAGLNDCILSASVEVCLKSNKTGMGRIVESRSVDYPAIKSWIDSCADQHKLQCGLSPDPLSLHGLGGLKVIECASGNVISFPGGEFVALSYCIGPKIKARKRANSTSKRSMQFAKVISDAMKCCLGLGYQYLWVDQICIDQNDSKVLAATISKMNLIYSSAALTIVSLGASQRDGLPGVSNIPRYTQASLTSGNTMYVTTMSGLPTAINASKWITRAWCFQEAVLSRRLVIFGEQQTYFICNSSTYCESIGVAMDHSGLALSGLRAQGRSHLLPTEAKQDDEGVWAFGSWVSAYTNRNFTFQGDALDAFRGILNVSKHESYWGIPFVLNTLQQRSHAIEAFAVGLSWSTSYNKYSDIYDWNKENLSCSRDFYHRSSFPSWSWSSCKTFKCPIVYKLPGDFIYESEIEIYGNSTPEHLNIYFEDENGTLSSIASIPGDWESGSPALAEKSRYIQIEADTIKIKLCKLESALDDSGHGIARFCVQVQGDSILSADKIKLPSVQPSDSPISELDDGRFLVDFDRPPTTKDGYCDKVHKKEYLGLILMHRSGVSDQDVSKENNVPVEGEFCVLLTERHVSGDFYTRAGLVWIDSDHLEPFVRLQQRIRLG